MNRTVPSSSPNGAIVAEASEWFVTFRYDNIDAGARQRFGEWLRRSPQHIQAYLEIASAWAELPDADAHGEIDLDALIARSRAAGAEVLSLDSAADARRMHSPLLSSRSENAEGSRFRGTRRIRIAASVAVLCVAGALGWYLADRDPEYVTAVAEQRSIMLADGSYIDLNARTHVRVHFSDGQRGVELLEGQALFRVAKDASRPFIVHSADTQVRAVGTQFDVYRKKDVTVVTVIEGRVTVASASASASAAAAAATATAQSAAGTRAGTSLREPASPAGRVAASFPAGSFYLAAGEQAEVTETAVSKSDHADVAAATAWTQKKLMFDATPLAEVASEFNRYNHRRLIVDDAQLGKLGISGVYSSTDPTSLLRFLREQPGVLVLESAEEVRITRAPPR
ncbi:MAG: FecR domain-containing protein [Gammaproteobacteria bacterium]